MGQAAEIKALSRLANEVGDFIRYWGFRRIHGQIWTVLYLTNEAKSPTELAEILDVSKSLISSALNELIDYELILEVSFDENKKTKYFEAEKDVFGVIQKILKTRELQIVSGAEKSLINLQSFCDKANSSIDADRTTEVLMWTQMAKSYVEFFSEFKDLGSLQIQTKV